ncbi:MAG: DUF748 domain-containing protein [Nitrospinaceae bacterium]|jgi:hypothetical protein|nr:DUF748 domain-containing protein [Nitrospinaceae bacterium]MBT5369935.1 DUF748 domain-containing protein [Nitrospinaceae bacterium]MBT5947468.1 DUF748 domain-containing protein [Nitrospinaceae bacterium]
MSRFLKWSVGILVVLLVLVVGAVVAVRFFVSSDQMKLLAVGYGSDYLGRKIKLDDLSIGLFVVEASGLEIEDKSRVGGDKQSLLKIKKVKALLNPAAILYKKISILSLDLSGVTVHASRDSTGKFSFDDIIEKMGNPKSARGPHRRSSASLVTIPSLGVSLAEAAENTPAASEPEYDFVIRDIEIADLKVSYDSAAFGALPAIRARCDFQKIEIDKFRLDEPLPVEVSGKCTEPGTIELSAEAEFDPRTGNLEVASSFKPFDLMPFVRLAPPVEDLQLLSARLGGESSVTLIPAKEVAWRVDFNVENVDAKFRMSNKGGWQRKKLASVELKSKGKYDLGRDAAKVSALDILLPFAKFRLNKQANWNVDGRDAADISLDVADLGAAVKWGASLAGVSLKKPPSGGKVTLKVSGGRDRKKEDSLRAVASIKMEAIELGAYFPLLPPQRNVRGLRGRLDGSADLSLSSVGPLKWKANFNGKGLAAQYKGERRGKWRPIKLTTAGVRSEGSFNIDDESARVASLEVVLPFAQVKLTGPAKWNVSGDDEIGMSVKIPDIGAAATLASSLSGVVIGKGDFEKGDKLDLDLRVSRNRKTSKAFSAAGSLSFDPIQVAPFAALVPVSSGAKGLRGVVGGKVTFLFKADENVSWKANLNGRGVSGQLDVDSDGRWVGLNLKSLQVGTDGWYSLRRESARINRLDVKLPFGSVKLLKEAKWNVSGVDDIAASWDISDLAAVSKMGRSLGVDALKMASPVGASKGSITIKRNRKKSKDFDMAGSASAELKRVHFADYPNMAVSGAASIKIDKKNLAISVPGLVVRERGRDKSPSAMELKNFRVSLSQKNLMKGRVVSRKATADALRINFSMALDKKTNIKTILAPPTGMRAGKSQKRRGKVASRTPKSRLAPSRQKKAAAPQTSQASGRKGASIKAPATTARLPYINIRRLEVGSLDFKFTHTVEAGKRPVVLEWKNLNLSIDNLNTRMRRGRLDGRISLAARTKPSPITFLAKMNPALDPPDLDGTLRLNQFDLTRFSAYAYSARGMEIRKGLLDLNSSFNLKNGYLRSRIKGKVFKLDLKQVKKQNVLGDAQAVLQNIALGILKRKNDVIPVSFKIKGRLNDPSFNTGRAVTDALIAGVINKLASLGGDTKKLGGQVGDILKGVLGGVLGTRPAPSKSQPPAGQPPASQPPASAPQTRVAPEPVPQVTPKATPEPVPEKKAPLTRKQRRRETVKEIENIGKDLLKGLFGGR